MTSSQPETEATAQLLLIPLHAILVPPERQRQEFAKEEMANLIASIKRIGLLHPITLRADRQTLIAGERRLRAIQEIAKSKETYLFAGKPVYPGSIPALILTPLNDLGIQTVEFEENDARHDLTWQERAIAVAKLHDLRMAQNPDHKLADTAEELTGKRDGSGYKTLQESLKVAKNLSDPEVRKAPSRREAIKLINAKMDSAFYEQYHNTRVLAGVHTFEPGDARDILPTFEDETFDCLLTDPPYGIDIDKGSASNPHDYDDSYDNWEDLIQVLASESFRLCKAKAHAYVFCDIRNFQFLSDTFARAGWDPWRVPLLWIKQGGQGRILGVNRGPRRSYEALMFAVKDERRTLATRGDSLIYPPDISPLHPAAKPVSLYKDLLTRTCYPSDKVLDPFCGGGTIFEAAQSLGFHATGIELNPTYIQYAKDRLAACTYQ